MVKFNLTLTYHACVFSGKQGSLYLYQLRMAELVQCCVGVNSHAA